MTHYKALSHCKGCGKKMGSADYIDTPPGTVATYCLKKECRVVAKSRIWAQENKGKVAFGRIRSNVIKLYGRDVWTEVSELLEHKAMIGE